MRTCVNRRVACRSSGADRGGENIAFRLFSILTGEILRPTSEALLHVPGRITRILRRREGRRERKEMVLARAESRKQAGRQERERSGHITHAYISNGGIARFASD